MEREEVLPGGVGNGGLVVRVGDRVLRPVNEHSTAIAALLRHVRDAGFTGAPERLGLRDDGREEFGFIPGEVPCVPFPEWSQTDAVLASTASLIRRFHDATWGFVLPPGATWSAELADPSGQAEVFCHNDVCPENVVYRDGVAVALLDFDFAAPGRRVHDLASFASMCVPIDAPGDAKRTGRVGLDPFTRLRVVADAYGLPPDRTDLVVVLGERLARGGEFVQRRVDAGEPAFIEMWNAMGGAERYERRHRWFEEHRQRFADALA